MSVSIISLNVCSIAHANRVTLLKHFIKQSNANIYLLQETQTDSLNKIIIPGYNILRGDVKRGWGGTAIILNNNIPIRNLKVSRDLIHATSIECKLSNSWHRVSSVYFPHCRLDGDIIKKFFSEQENTFFGGDFNSRHVSFGDISNNLYGNILFNLAQTTNLKIFNAISPTCLRSTFGSYIDKFITNSNFSPSGYVVTLPSFSDHFAIKCLIPLETPDTHISVTKLRLFNKVKTNNLNSFIFRNLNNLALPIDQNLMNGDCEQVAINIENIFTSAVERFVPVSKCTQHRVLFSQATLALLRESKNIQRKIFALGPLPPVQPLTVLKMRLKLVKNMILNSVRFETSKFFTNAFNSVQTSRDAFKVIKNFSGHKKRGTLNGSLFLDKDKTASVSGDENIANVLAENFYDKHNLTSNINSDYANLVHNSIVSINNSNPVIKFDHNISPCLSNDKLLSQLNAKLPAESRGILTSSEEVSYIINSRANKKSTGSDNMPFSVIKKFDSRIILFLTIFFNHLLAISYFPRCWQYAIITPIPKPGKDASLIENWRPISMLCCISKIFERILAIRLNKHRDSLQLFQNQFGFLGGHSTNHALARLQADINEGLNDNKITTIVALDLKAAFDTIWHDGLVHKLLSLNFPIYIIKIIKSMLSFRRFAVRLNGHLSKILKMGAGVPQGSVLGPLLFILYVHDIPLHNSINITQFADDTTLHVVHKDPAQIQNLLNIYLVKISKFFKNWKLVVNKEKTELIHIMGCVRDTNLRLRKLVRNMKICLNGHLLPVKNEIRLLGMQLQTNNKFTKHIQIRLTKAKKAKFHLSRIFKNSKIDTKIKTNMYKIYIRSILMYASPVWVRQPQVSSHQMELLRLFERGCLRSTANIRRARGSFKNIRVSKIYDTSLCMRIDRFAALSHIAFYNKCSSVDGTKFTSLMRRFGNGQFYNCMPSLLDQHNAGNLIINDDLKLFKTRYDNRPGLVYNTS